MFAHLSVEEVVSSVLLCVVVMLVLVGNCLVVAAVATSRKLRTVTNMFIVNLACSDLMLGVLVLPFSASLEILDTWTFGHIWCQIWLAVDVWLCTASILNLCCISLDRYLAITRPVQYPGIMTARRVKLLVAGSWVFSFIICCPPLIGWNSLHDDDDDVTTFDSTTVFPSEVTVAQQRTLDCVSSLILPPPNDDNSSSSSANLTPPCYAAPPNITHTKCELTNSRGYRVYAALGSFYIPMLVMVFFYLQIYRAAVRTIIAYEKGELKTKYSSGDNSNGSKSNNSVTLRVHRGGGSLSSRTGSTYTRSPGRRACNTSDVSLDTLSDLVRTDCPSGEAPSRTNSAKENNKCKEVVYTSCGSFRRSKSVEKPVVRNSHSFRNGGRGFRLPSQDSEEGCNPDGRGGRNNGTDRNHRDSFRVSHSRQSSTSTSRGAGFKHRPLSRESSDRDSGRIKRNMFSVHRPAHAMKLHMQKFNREKKAAKTLAIIVGAFIVCWLPFFTIYLVGAFCDECISTMLFSVAFWLGYCNSAMNPCVYALFSRDFRQAFRKLILCRFRSQPRSFRPQLSDLPAIQLHSPPREEFKSSSELSGSGSNHWR